MHGCMHDQGAGGEFLDLSMSPGVLSGTSSFVLLAVSVMIDLIYKEGSEVEHLNFVGVFLLSVFCSGLDRMMAGFVDVGWLVGATP